jgi:short-subunit dehydrogenase
MNHSNPAPVAVITGVSSGLGRAMALCFRRNGFRVVGVSRSQPDFELDLWIGADVTKAEDRLRVVHETVEFGGRADVLVNNAGKGLYATWEEADMEELKSLFELNVFAVAGMTQAFLPLLKASRGTVINISSAAGRLWVFCMGAYCATKASVSMFSDSLRGEVRRYGVRVLDVSPGQINTGFSSRSFGRRRPPDSPGASADPDAFARAVYKAWKRGRKSMTYPGWLGAVLFGVRYLVPGIYNHFSLKMWKLK